MSTSDVDPCIALALYDGRRASTAVAAASRDIKDLLDDGGPNDFAVMDHSDCDGDSANAHRTLRTMGVRRIWQGVPANRLIGLARDRGANAAAAQAAQWARWSVDQGCEVFMLNGESGGDPARDWDVDRTVHGDREFLATTCTAIVDAVGEALAGRTAFAFTSHDMPKHWRLVWEVLLGRRSPITLWSPQRYPADEKRPGLEGFHEASARCASTDSQWQALADAGTVRAEFAPEGRGYAPYAQVHGMTPGAIARLLDAPVAAAWAGPRIPVGRMDAVGFTALRAVLRMRAVVGPEMGLVQRYQRSRNLTPDGNAGRETLASLGL